MEMLPCMSAPPCPATCFACRPDWRLNLVLNAGNSGCAEAIPVFEPMDEAAFDALVNSAMQKTLADCGVIGQDSIELPYSLCRYRDDAPPGGQQEPPERRWARALLLQTAEAVKVGYCRTYSWSMRDQLEQLDNSQANNECLAREPVRCSVAGPGMALRDWSANGARLARGIGPMWMHGDKLAGA